MSRRVHGQQEQRLCESRVPHLRGGEGPSRRVAWSGEETAEVGRARCHEALYPHWGFELSMRAMGSQWRVTAEEWWEEVFFVKILLSCSEENCLERLGVHVGRWLQKSVWEGAVELERSKCSQETFERGKQWGIGMDKIGEWERCKNFCVLAWVTMEAIFLWDRECWRTQLLSWCCFGVWGRY